MFSNKAPIVQPIAPPMTEQIVHPVASLSHRNGLEITVAIKRGSTGMGKIIDSRAEKI